MASTQKQVVIVEPLPTTVLIQQTTNSVVISDMGIQGPPGPPG